VPFYVCSCVVCTFYAVYTFDCHLMFGMHRIDPVQSVYTFDSHLMFGMHRIDPVQSVYTFDCHLMFGMHRIDQAQSVYLSYILICNKLTFCFTEFSCLASLCFAVIVDFC